MFFTGRHSCYEDLFILLDNYLCTQQPAVKSRKKLQGTLMFLLHHNSALFSVALASFSIYRLSFSGFDQLFAIYLLFFQ
jgi:hypothetical protein